VTKPIHYKTQNVQLDTNSGSYQLFTQLALSLDLFSLTWLTDDCSTSSYYDRCEWVSPADWREASLIHRKIKEFFAFESVSGLHEVIPTPKASHVHQISSVNKSNEVMA
jgi:hypothetical protein